MAGLMETVNQRTQLVGQNRLELLLFKLDGKQVYGINVFKVKEVLQCPELTSLPKSHRVVRGVAHIRGSTIPIMDLSLATGNQAITDIKQRFVIITEYNMKTQGFLVNAVERIINMNWEVIQPPPKGTGNEHYLTAVTKYDGRLVEIIDVEKVLSEVAPVYEEFDKKMLTNDTADAVKSTEVLIVDDSKIARKQVRKTLEKLGVIVTSLNDGKEAWNHLNDLLNDGINPQDKYAMIISDIEMPEMDGYTLTSEIRSNNQLSEIYIVLHTSLSGVFNKAMVQKVGANDFLAKFQPETLADLVVNHITKYQKDRKNK